MWPPEALEFLRDLEANNDSEWFRAERHRYDAFLLAPARELAEKLTDLGRPHFFRPYNNLRFRPGPPIKEQLGVAIGMAPRAASTSSSRWTACSSPPACINRRPTSSSASAPRWTTTAAPAASCGG